MRTNPKKELIKVAAEQSALMAISAALIVPSVALMPLTLVLRNKREKMTQEQQSNSKLVVVHEALAGSFFFCAATILQGPQVIKGAYERAYPKKKRF